jgi:hypothetical protein
MGYLGYKPADKPLTAADITDGIITSAKIVDGTIVNGDINASAGVVFTKLASTGTLTVDNIQFPATQVASANANNLDDYEEGSWTPTLTRTTTNPTITSYANRVGTYTKIGNRVYVSCYLRVDISSVGSGDVVVTGLPFTAAGNLQGISFGISTIMATIPLGGYINGTSVIFETATLKTGNNYLTFSLQYEV